MPGPRRLAGADRAATAIAVGDALVPDDDSRPRQAVLVNGFASDGWAYGLVAAGIAQTNLAPVLLVDREAVPAATAAAVSACGVPEVDHLVVGNEAVISAGIRAQLQQLDGGAC